jgi:hypothetical protein
MESPQELRDQFVFSRKSEEDESTVMTYQSASSEVASPGVTAPQSKAEALAAAGLLGDRPAEAPMPRPSEEEDAVSDEDFPNQVDPSKSGVNVAPISTAVAALDDTPVLPAPDAEGKAGSVLFSLDFCSCANSRFAEAVTCEK